MPEGLTLGSLFDGIGGWCLAAVRAGIRPIWSSEIEKFPLEVTARHFPDVVQLGDVTKIDGAKIEPVDIICAGSPCQDLSIAGRRAGLAGERSGLFVRAIEIVRQIRKATGGRYPRFFVWENVPGAFTSNRGQDFRTVLEEIGETSIPVPRFGKWANAGLVRTKTADIAWRVLDAQYWGVPQRRKRIFLVADFASAGRCAAEVLFVEQGLHGNFAESEREREETATDVGASIDSASRSCAVLRMRSGCAGGGKGPLVSKNKSLTLATSNDQTLFVPKSICWEMNQPRNKINDYSTETTSPTLTARMGTGGNQVPIVHSVSDSASGFKYRQGAKAGGIGWQNGKAPTPELSQNCAIYSFDSLASNSMKSKNPHSGCRQVEVSKTLDTTIPDPSKNQGGIAIYDISHRQDVIRPQENGTLPCLTARAGTGGNNLPVVHSYCIAGNTIDRQPQNGGNGTGNQEELAYTLNTADRHAVVSYTSQSYTEWKEGEPMTTLRASGGFNGGGSENLATYNGSTVRRLTPLECERLQGLPDGYTDIEFNGKPAPDSRRYKAIGNGMAQPCADFIMRQIARYAWERQRITQRYGTRR